MDPETKKAAEFCQIAGVGHVVASKPPLKPIERYRPVFRPVVWHTVLTPMGFAWIDDMGSWWYRSSDSHDEPTWWAYLPEGDE